MRIPEPNRKASGYTDNPVVKEPGTIVKTLIERSRISFLALMASLGWMPPLLMRLFVGYFFFETGWGKLHNLDAFAERFAGWGIPYPAFSATLSAYTECIGGAPIVAGLLTRLVSIPLIINMTVAILTVKLKKVTGLDDFVELDEPLYVLTFFWLIVAGPGYASLDYLIARALGFECRCDESPQKE
jgi:putative oxidoreductase